MGLKVLFQLSLLIVVGLTIPYVRIQAFGNLGKILILKTLWTHFSTKEVNSNPLYALAPIESVADGLISQASPAQWSLGTVLDPKTQGELLQGAFLLEQTLVSSKQPMNYIWAARIYRLLSENMKAVDLATKAIDLGLNSGHQELGYIYDGLGESETALNEYEASASRISIDFRLANYLLLTENCMTFTCQEEYFHKLSTLDPWLPSVVWASVIRGDVPSRSILTDSNWSHKEPRLQQKAAEVLNKALEAGAVTLAESRELIHYWLESGQLDALSHFVRISKGHFRSEEIIFWLSLAELQRENYESAYKILSAVSDDGHSENFFGQLARYSRLRAWQSNGMARSEWLTNSKFWYHQAVTVDPRDMILRKELIDLAKELNEIQDSMGGSNQPDIFLKAKRLVDESCNTGQTKYDLGRNLLLSSTSKPSEWSWAVRNQPPYAKANYHLGITSKGYVSLQPALMIHGVSTKLVSPGELPSWAGVTTLQSFSFKQGSRGYLLTFAYRTERITSDSIVLELTPNKKFSLPAIDNGWRYFGVVIPIEGTERTMIRPAFRLYHTTGSLYIQDLQLREIRLSAQATRCSRWVHGVLQ